ncbi:MAG TPA: SMC-Scp complex subunit ScpB [Candidatus Omnitrophica bacterium]|nr:SMC-Scp complex subunit ScpB [Candidatus Omnitrophota bacterium]
MENTINIKNAIEAFLFVSDKPLSLDQIKDVLNIDRSEIKSEIDALKEEYKKNHSFRLREVAGGYQMVTDPEYAPWLRKLFQGGQKGRLSKPALETLAIVAYKQPLTKPEIEQIRGVDVDGVIKTLQEKGLVKITGRKQVIGRPLLYATTKKFLEYFGLNSLEELPVLNEFVEMEQENEDNRAQKED